MAYKILLAVADESQKEHIEPYVRLSINEVDREDAFEVLRDFIDQAYDEYDESDEYNEEPATVPV